MRPGVTGELHHSLQCVSRIVAVTTDLLIMIITIDKKYHVEHFTCSVCPTLFGPQDSYYEHEGDVFCHLHYSTRFATKCAGCNTAILKQFVEINRNNRDECWHPECYMINKVSLTSSRRRIGRSSPCYAPVLECEDRFKGCKQSYRL